jgi:DNA (cytosine-5)-methyltransferase 1
VSLVLSLFPGIGLLDMAFEEEGFCVVRGPDLLWGGDIRRFHPPAGKFDGVIGGPPCQVHSTASEIRGTEATDLIPEFVRCVEESRPDWFVMENVVGAPVPDVDGYCAHSQVLSDHWVGGLTMRRRRFTFGTADGRALPVELAALQTADPSHAVMATTWKRGNSKYVTDKGFLRGDLPAAEYARLQCAPDVAERLSKLHAGKPFIVHVLGNGVPLPMGRAIARAVRQAVTAGAATTKGDPDAR